VSPWGRGEHREDEGDTRAELLIWRVLAEHEGMLHGHKSWIRRLEGRMATLEEEEARLTADVAAAGIDRDELRKHVTALEAAAADPNASPAVQAAAAFVAKMADALEAQTAPAAPAAPADTTPPAETPPPPAP
jgi:peptidoglycan hydrolase CwlO-like protein